MAEFISCYNGWKAASLRMRSRRNTHSGELHCQTSKSIEFGSVALPFQVSREEGEEQRRRR